MSQGRLARADSFDNSLSSSYLVHFNLSESSPVCLESKTAQVARGCSCLNCEDFRDQMKCVSLWPPVFFPPEGRGANRNVRERLKVA